MTGRLIGLTYKYISVISILMVSTFAKGDPNLFTNLTGSATNNQGHLTYSIPLDFPSSVNGLVPKLAAVYRQASSRGNFGAGIHLQAVSSIARCQSSVEQGQGKKVGGVSTNKLSTYCLDGSQLIYADDGYYRPADQPKTKVEFTGSYERPNTWEVFDEKGYIYTYESLNEDEKEHNRVWKIKTKSDRFKNSIRFIYDQDGIKLEKIKYPGFEIQINYNGWSSQQAIYSNGVEKNIDRLVDEIALYRNNKAIYSYKFNYENYSGYKGVRTKRLKGVKQCYQVGSETCSKELTLAYKDFEGYTLIDGMPEDSTIAIDSDHLESHSNPDEYSSPNLVTTDIDLRNGNDICFYSGKDNLLCAIANKESGYSVKEFLDYSTSFGYTHADSKYYMSPYFIDIDGDLYPDLCMADRDGVKCAKNSRGNDFESPFYISKQVDFQTGVMFVDLSRDGKPDLCGIFDNSSVRCFKNLGGMRFSESAFFENRDGYSSHFITQLKDPEKKETERYKHFDPSFQDCNWRSNSRFLFF